MMVKQFVLLLLVIALAYGNNCERMNFLPMPDELTCGEENITISDPCKILYHVKIDEKGN